MSDALRLSAALNDQYRIDREIGAGGMATVYLAHDVRHGRQVAMKVLHPELSAVIGAERFLAEIRTTAALQHPHILPLFDSGSADGLLFYVMPFVDGETLRARLTREKQLPVADAVRIAREIAAALDYAHRRGVIHRDIKPENILLHEGQALVADFGIALAVQSAGGQRMTQTGLSLGTPQYMSPEQAMGERDITARSDVYALGAITYEMLVGEPPFTGATAQAVFAKVMTEEPRPIIPQRKTVPPEVEAAVLNALEKLPADRFGSAAEFAAALERPLSTTTARTASAHAPQRGIRSIAFWILGVAAALAIGFFGGRTAGGSDASAPVNYAQKTFADYPIFNARYAPDGKTLVYSATPPGGRVELFVVRPDYAEPQSLGLEATHLLSVSSKGELAVVVRAIYLSQRLFRGTLARVALGGGAPRELVENVREGDWAPDGSDIAFVRILPGTDRLEFPAGKVLVESSGYLSDPAFSPDGRYIAFVEHPFRYDNRGTIAIVDLAGKKTLLTPDEFSGIEGVAWSRDGDEVFFSARAATHQMVVQGVTLKGKLRAVLNGAGDLTIQDVSADGQLLVTRESALSSIFVRGPGQTEERDAGWLDYPFRPTLSADGSMIAFGDASFEGGVNYSVVVRKTDGGRATRLGEGAPSAFSRDGKWLLSVIPSKPARVILYPTGAGAPREVPVGTLTGIANAEWGPDEKSVLLCGSEQGKPPACYLQSLDGGPLRPMPFATAARVSPDGRMILVAVPGEGTRLATFSGDSMRPIPGFFTGDAIVRWSPDSRALWVRKGRTLRVERLDIATGRRTVILDAASPATAGMRSVAGLQLADDPNVYAYQSVKKVSQIFTVGRVR